MRRAPDSHRARVRATTLQATAHMIGHVDPAEQSVLRIAQGHQFRRRCMSWRSWAWPTRWAAVAHFRGHRGRGRRAGVAAATRLRALVVAGVFDQLEDGRFASNDAAARRAPTHPAACATSSSTSARSVPLLRRALAHRSHRRDRLRQRLRSPRSSTRWRTRPRRRARRPARALGPCPWLASSPRPTSCATRACSSTSAVGRGPLWRKSCETTARPPVSCWNGRGCSAREGVPLRARRGRPSRAVEGDFFASVPTGGDVYVLKSILHHSDDDRCAPSCATAAPRWTTARDG